ncbi:swr complex subunit [Ascosphaera atra]|nr:swr complex subunit [Ascosphaera atra]
MSVPSEETALAKPDKHPEQAHEEEDDDYNSEDDPDFDVNQPMEDESEDDGEDEEEQVEGDEDTQRPKKRRKVARKGGNEETKEDLASGDEATARGKASKPQKGKKKRGGKQKGGESDFSSEDEDDVGGEGGLIKTRAQRLREQQEKKAGSIAQGNVTVDVDALWERLNAPTTVPEASAEQEQENVDKTKATQGDDSHDQDSNVNTAETKPIVLPNEEKVTIKRVYKFAGETITEEHVVPRDSAEAKLYMSSVDGNAQLGEVTDTVKVPVTRTNDNGEPLRRPPRRYSRFDPNPPDAIKRNWSAMATAAKDIQEATKGPKLNTVMKSKLDWAAYVDKAGIKEDLDTHSRAKEGYLERMDFLNRVDQKREEERKNARLRGM